MSFKIWESFASTHPDAERHRYHDTTITNPETLLSHYCDQLSPFTSSAGSWLTLLIVNLSQLTIKDLISISNLQNLACLRFGGASQSLSNLDDRMMWSWAQYISRSEQSSPLKHLRLIEFIGHPNLTLQGIEHLSVFPALVQVKLGASHIGTICSPVAGNSVWRFEHDERSDDWVREYIEGRTGTKGDATRTEEPRGKARKLKYIDLLTEYARACSRVNGACAVEQACSRPVLQLTLGAKSRSDASMKGHDPGVIFYRTLQEVDAYPDALNSKSVPCRQQSPGNSSRGTHRCHSKRRKLKTEKQSSLDDVICSFMPRVGKQGL